MRTLMIVFGVLMLVAAANGAAHSGRTDKDGCHVDRKTGIRHCH